jgi:uncharacterized protein YggE
VSFRPRTSIALLALLALALAVPAAASAVDRTVAVSATATLKVPNDSASLGFSVSQERRSRGAALGATSAKLRAVIAAAQGIAGVGPGDVKTGRISVRKTSRGRTTLYRAAEGIGVTLHQPENAGDLVSAAIGAGATGLSGPNFFVGDTDAASNRALAAAFEKAKARAAVLATAAGAVLGPAISIGEGERGGIVEFEGAAKGAPDACETASAPVKTLAASRCTGTKPPPTKPGVTTVTATVSAVFELQ